MRSDKEVLLSTKPFAHEIRWLSWWHLGSTIVAVAMLIAVASSDLAGMLRLPFSILAGLTLVRLFVLYHDHQHGSLLRGSKIADGLMTAFGIWSLNPPSVWKRSHDHHHHNNSKLHGPNVGSFPLMTVENFRRAGRIERLQYAASRHPLTIIAGYLTIFFVGMCVAPLIANPRRHIDALLSIVCHGLFLMWLAQDGFDDLWLAGVLPFMVGSAVGAYLFFAQHNFPGSRIEGGRKWSHCSAALKSSSYVQMGPVMRWFTGNIGYHHMHHLNARIPFYRLPEAMNAIPEAQTPVTITLGVRDVAACMRLKLWDTAAEQLVSWPVEWSKAQSAPRTIECKRLIDDRDSAESASAKNARSAA